MIDMNGWKRIESQKNRYYKCRGNNVFEFIDIFPSSKNTDNDTFYVVCATVDISHADETDYDEAMGYLDSTDGQDDEGMKILDRCLASSWFEKKRYVFVNTSVIISKETADFIVKKYIESDGDCFLCTDENLIGAKLNCELDEDDIADLLKFGCYCDSDDFYDDIASMIMNRFEIPRNVANVIVRRERNLFDCFTDEEFVGVCVSTADFVRDCIDLYLDRKD